MKILFLDIDGVLNSAAWIKSRPSKEEFAAEHGVSPEVYDNDRLTWSLRSVDPAAVAALNAIVNRTHARVVLSSSWRTMWALTRMNWILRRRGFEHDLIGATPCAWDWEGPKPDGITRWQRGHEIEAWLRTAAIPGLSFTDVVILDDDGDMAELQSRLFQTDVEVGLRLSDVDTVVEMFGR